MATPDEIQAAARADLHGRVTEAQLTPRELAEGAWYPGAPKSVDQLEDEIRDVRGMTPLNRRAS